MSEKDAICVRLVETAVPPPLKYLGLPLWIATSREGSLMAGAQMMLHRQGV